MSQERAARLQHRWYSEDPSFGTLVHGALDRVGFTENYVNFWIAEAESGRVPRKDKVVKDNVWGMVKLDWSSARLLDSPLVQRMRSIKQLGFTSLTYPSAEHSRFVHSLGMFAVVSRFIESISNNKEWGEPKGGI